MLNSLPISLLTPSFGSSPYVVKAVHFDGGTALYRVEPLIGVSDSSTGTVAFCFRTDAYIDDSAPWCQTSTLTSNTKPSIDVTLSQTHFQKVSTTLQWELYLTDADYSNDIDYFPAGAVEDVAWHQIVYSWNTNHDTGERVTQVAVDGVLKTTTIRFEDGGPFAAAFSAIATIVGAEGYGSNPYGDTLRIPWVGDLADLYLNFADFTDLTIQSNIEKFWISGKPADPTGFPSGACVLLSGDATGFQVNQGSGGAFILDTASVVVGNGSNGPGPVNVNYAPLGLAVTSVFDTTTSQDVTSGFEGVVTVLNEVQQTSAEDYSADNLVFTLTGTLTNATTSPSD